MDPVDVTAGETAASEIAVVASPSSRSRRSARRSLAGWVRGGGLSALLFALPMLVIFAAFSWYPIVRLVLLSFQETNLFDPPTPSPRRP